MALVVRPPPRQFPRGSLGIRQCGVDDPLLHLRALRSRSVEDRISGRRALSLCA